MACFSDDQINGQVEALDEFGVFDASYKQLRHLHLQEVRRKSLDLVMIYLQLHCQKRCGIRSDLEHGWQAEERHAVKHHELFLL